MATKHIAKARNSSEQEPAYQEIDYDLNGKRLSIWDGSSGIAQQGQVYWGSKPVAFYKDNEIHFQHGDWLGSERVTTSYNGATESSIGHYPFGEIKSSSGNQIDADQFGQLDHNIAANTEHAQFREYYGGDGHWLSPDPYDGSYDGYNPQSFNRYSYVLNNPMSYNDPSGLKLPPCTGTVCAVPGVPGGVPPIMDGSGLTNPGLFTIYNEFQPLVTVSSPDGDGAYSYTDASWNATASSDTGNTVVGSGIYSNADGGIGGLAVMSTFWGMLSGIPIPQFTRATNPNITDVVSANPPHVKLTQGQILGLCIMAAQLQGGGTVPGGSNYGTASTTPSEDTPAQHLPIPDWRHGGFTSVQIDSASARVSAYGAMASVGGTIAACVGAVGAVNY